MSVDESWESGGEEVDGVEGKGHVVRGRPQSVGGWSVVGGGDAWSEEQGLLRPVVGSWRGHVAVVGEVN
jgi:hypothetical protein